MLNIRPENTHYWGMHHCTAAVQFYKFGFACFTTYKNNIFFIKSILVKLETSCTVILPQRGECFLIRQ